MAKFSLPEAGMLDSPFPLKHAMIFRRIFVRNLILLLAVTLIAGCTTAPSISPMEIDARKVLILSPQGVSPSKDTVGFNMLVKNVTQAFSSEFSKQLSLKGFYSVNVLDQDPALNTGQKMAVYSVKNMTEKIVIPTIESKTIGKDDQIQLRIQFIEGEFIPSNSSPKEVRARTVIEKSYLLRGSESGDTSMSMSDMAKDFSTFVEDAGRLKK